MSTWVTAISNISARINFLLLTSVTFLRAITMCSAFTFDCGYDNSTIILIGDVYCPNTKCSGKLCLHKETFQFSISRQKGLSMPATRICVPGAEVSFWRSNKFLFCRLVKGFTFLKRIQNHFEMSLEMCFVPVSIVSTERNAIVLAVM